MLKVLIIDNLQRLIELADGMSSMTRGVPYRKFRPFNTRKHHLSVAFILHIL